MTELGEVRGWLEERFAGLVVEHDVPGAAIAVLAGGETAERAAGVLNTATGVAATIDSVFQLASITKAWTAALVMQLVDEARLDLDRPVREYLPGFRVAHNDATAVVTSRHLLSHTAGFDEEPFTESEHGDGAIGWLVDQHLPTVGQLFAPGDAFSYSNPGFTLLGRIVEVLRDKPYRQVLRERLIDPLGLAHAATRADEAVRFRVAVGHQGSAAWQRPAVRWALPYSNEPAGAMLAMSACDLLQFARMHLRGGLAPDGTRLLTEASMQAMRQPQVALPPLNATPVHWGLGLHIEHHSHGRIVVGHDGDNIGQYAMLRFVPDREVAFVLFCNGGDASGLFRSASAYLLAELAGIDLPPRPTPPPEPLPVDPYRYVGGYRAAEGTVTVSASETDGPVTELWLALEPGPSTTRIMGASPTRHRIVRYQDDTFLTADPGSAGGAHRTFAFIGDDQHGRAAFFHHHRAIPRTR